MIISRRKFLKTAGAGLAMPYVPYGQVPYPAERIGPMLMVGFDGASSQAFGVTRMAEQIAAGHVGGICFIAKNAVTRPGVESITRLFHAVSDKWPLLMAIDQEGGQVQRLSSHLGFGYQPSAIRVASDLDYAGAHKVYAAMAQDLRKSGFNLNLAPVVDLGFEPRCASITRLGRSYGAEPGTVIKYSRQFLTAHREQNVLTALKHFPGHGSALGDSHEGGVDITRTWRESELLPYRTLVLEDRADMIMVGHIAHAELTFGAPASLSPEAVGLLRNQVGFEGVVITDDLDMRAVRKDNSLEEAAIRAVMAGNDILLFTDKDSLPDLPQRLIAAVQLGIATRRIAPEQIEASVARIEKMKAGLAVPRVGPPI